MRLLKYPRYYSNCVGHTILIPSSENQNFNASKGKENHEIHITNSSTRVKGKDSIMGKRAFNQYILTPQQRDQAMKEGFCYYRCLG